jgi:hypothetical protein
VVTAELFDADAQRLRERVLRLERRNEILLAIVRLLFVLVRMAGLRLDFQRVPQSSKRPRAGRGSGAGKAQKDRG